MNLLMRVALVSVLSATLLVATGCSRNLPETSADRVLQRACAYLWSVQSDDGAWHSETHGLMRGGEATTAFVLYALLEAGPVCAVDAASRDAALGFLRSKVTEQGSLGLSDPDIVDYPNYATAYALGTFAKHGADSDRELVERMSGYLVFQQFDTDRGIDPGHPAFGGWGFGESLLIPGAVGHLDLSHTRRMLEVLREAGALDSETSQSARIFLALHQRDRNDARVARAGAAAGTYDGGFFASAAVPVVNKSNEVGHDGPIHFFESYATATADGLLGLLAAGVQPENGSVMDARNWLLAHPDFGYPAGIPTDNPPRWGRVMFHYHIMVRAEAYRALGGLAPSGWRNEVALLLEPRQLDDGHFVNPYGAPNKEDDPLIATAMTVVALAQPSRPG